MTDKVTNLTEKLAEPDEDVIGMLEDALELARKGDMREVLIYGTLTGNEQFRAGTYNDGTALIGVLMGMILDTDRGMGGTS